MRAQFRLSDLIPARLNVQSVHDAADAIVVTASARPKDSICPHGGTAYRRVHEPLSQPTTHRHDDAFLDLCDPASNDLDAVHNPSKPSIG